MELVRQASSTQILFPVAAVAVVLICAALVFIFGFHSAEQPQFDKLPLVLDDRKSKDKKRKPKEKKSSPNRNANEESKTKSEKKSPSKEKKEVKEPEKPKSKEKPAEPKSAKKDDLKKGKKKANPSEKPSDFDEGVWEEVPKKVFTKKVKTPEEKKEEKKVAAAEKKESPKREKREPKVSSAVKGAGDAAPVQEEIQLAPTSEEGGEEKTMLISASSNMDEDVLLALQAQVEEVQRKLKEADRRQQVALGLIEDDTEEKELTDVKDLRSTKKQENKEKQKRKSIEAIAYRKSESLEEPEPVEKVEEAPAPVFDELGDTWTESKAPKKGKKKARKDQ